MGTQSSSASTSTSTSTSSPCGKRSRDPEDEVYVDNLHSHKRYLSEIMAYSLNGLTVGDSLPDNIMDSPARFEGMLYLRDDTALQYSPMSEDSDDSRFCEYPTSICSSQPESLPTSPVSPYRYQRQLTTFSSSTSTSSNPSSHACPATVASCSQPRQRGPETEGRFPSSPSDICHSGDLRRAALLRSVQMRAQPSGPSFEMPFCSAPHMDADACFKSSDEEKEYRVEDHSLTGVSDPEAGSRSKSCKMLNMNMKGDKSAD